MDIKIIDKKRSLVTLNMNQCLNIDLCYPSLSNPYTHLENLVSHSKTLVNTIEEEVSCYNVWLTSEILKESKEHYRPRTSALTDLYNKAFFLFLSGKTVYLVSDSKDELQPSLEDHNNYCEIIRTVLLKRLKKDCEINCKGYYNATLLLKDKEFEILYRITAEKAILISVLLNDSPILSSLQGRAYTTTDDLLNDVKTYL